MTLAPDPTWQNPGTGWTVQLNSGSGTGLCHMGVVAGELGYTSSTINGVQQSKSPGGASGPLSATYADPAGTGAVSVDQQKRFIISDIPPSHPADALQGVY